VSAFKVTSHLSQAAGCGAYRVNVGGNVYAGKAAIGEGGEPTHEVPIVNLFARFARTFYHYALFRVLAPKVDFYASVMEVVGGLVERPGLGDGSKSACYFRFA
jgi:hypothetical protein